MSSPARKKRKTGAASEGGTAGILSIEMIGKVASFANYGDDLMNICKAVGRKDSAVIRYTCLRNNYRYLQLAVERNIREIATNKKPVPVFGIGWLLIPTGGRNVLQMRAGRYRFKS